MRRRAFLLCASIGLAAQLMNAQQGHPLTGTWSGDYGASATQRTKVTFVLNWDGKQVTGLMNPGPDSIPVNSVYVDPATWTVRFEVDMKDPAGKPVHVIAEGKLEDLGSYHRWIAGTFRHDNVKGDFKIVRD
jgi:hypothetical protein